MSVLGVGAAAATPFVPPTISAGGAGGAGGAGKAGASGFAKSLESVSSLTNQADAAAQGVATGGLQDIHQFTTAAAKAQLGVELTVSLRNRAVEAYQEIMRMQV
ncbi:MAG: fliE [Frankiales bacterium]|nr:fliE [Frankiales bacterium]